MTDHIAATHYEAVATTLGQRILDLIPEHPEILDMESTWDLLRIPEFRFSDLQPSLFQASWALSWAKEQAKR